MKSALAATKPVRGAAISPKIFIGKPLLVIFFAS
jgi:hypothetical protein